MARPAHIAPLDAALEAAKKHEQEARARYDAVLDEHLAAFDTLEAIILDAQRERVDAFYAIGRIEGAIKKLGYVLLSKPFEGGLDIAAEKDAARARRSTTDTEGQD